MLSGSPYLTPRKVSKSSPYLPLLRVTYSWTLLMMMNRIQYTLFKLETRQKIKQLYRCGYWSLTENAQEEWHLPLFLPVANHLAPSSPLSCAHLNDYQSIPADGMRTSRPIFLLTVCAPPAPTLSEPLARYVNCGADWRHSCGQCRAALLRSTPAVCACPTPTVTTSLTRVATTHRTTHARLFIHFHDSRYFYIRSTYPDPVLDPVRALRQLG